MAAVPVSIFISYAREDEADMQELVSHLEPLQWGGLVDTWHDGKILPGQEWAQQIQQNLEAAQIILLLISKDFMRSDYCYRVELTKAIERHKAGEAQVIPVILRPCLWDYVIIGDVRLSDLQALPKGAKPVNQWSDRDTAFTDVARALANTIEQHQPAALIGPAPVRPSFRDDLSSERGMDYGPLRRLLRAQDWKGADQETYEVMIRAMGKTAGDWFSEADLLAFPAGDLRTIDRLWVKYSQGRFGFSVQRHIYVACGATLDGKYPGDQIWRQFADTVGWRVNGMYISYKDVIASIAAPVGHLPLWVGVLGGGWFLSRTSHHG